MDEMKKPLMVMFISILFILILSSVSFAEEDGVFVKVLPINDEISELEEASFNISIVNTKNYTDTFSLYSPNIDIWSIKLNPSSLKLNPSDDGIILLRAKPKDVIISGREYGILLNIRSDKDSELQKVYAFVNVMSQEQLDAKYTPIILMNVSDIGKLDPTVTSTFTLDLENKNVRNIEKLKIKLSSDVFDEEIFSDLEPLQKKIVQFTLSMPDSTAPLEDNLIIALWIDNTTILSKSVNYEVVGIEKQDYEAEFTHSLMLTNHDVVIMNQGNLDVEGKYTVSTNLLNYFFIRGSASSRLEFIDGHMYKLFYKQLQPGESYNLTVVVSYRPIIYLIIALIVIITLYYLFRSPLIIRKSVSSIKTKEGSLSELKVLLHIKNRTKKNYEDLIVLDRIPKITEIGKEFEIGTIRPTKIMSHEKKGTIAKWEMNSLDSYEERVIAYKLYSNLNIMGGLTLPIALLKYKIRGREKKASSNKIKLVIQNFKGDKKESKDL